MQRKEIGWKLKYMKWFSSKNRYDKRLSPFCDETEALVSVMINNGIKVNTSKWVRCKFVYNGGCNIKVTMTPKKYASECEKGKTQRVIQMAFDTWGLWWEENWKCGQWNEVFQPKIKEDQRFDERSENDVFYSTNRTLNFPIWWDV